LELLDGIGTARRNLPQLGHALKGCKRLLIASHNNPDPDSIASAIVLRTVLQRKFRLSTTLAYSGVVGRAENSALLDYSRAPFCPLESLDLNEFDGVALVDTQPGTGNNPFDDVDKVRAVFAHHRLKRQTRRVAFHDVRPRVGATTTLLYFYWKAARIRMSKRNATLMFYALQSETADMGRKASHADREAYKLFYAAADLGALSSIANAKVENDYFAVVHRAIEHAREYGPR